jgi:hypothetical protein
VGEDNASFGWVARHPDMHDIHCRDVTLTGQNFKTNDVRKPGSKETAETGAYVPFGTKTTKGQMIRGQIRAAEPILRIPLAGGRSSWSRGDCAIRSRSRLAPITRSMRSTTATTIAAVARCTAPAICCGDRARRLVRLAGLPRHASFDTGDHFHAPNHDKPQPLIIGAARHSFGAGRDYSACTASADGIAFAPETFGYRRSGVRRRNSEISQPAVGNGA